MPQLDSATYVSQIFWLITTFLSLWFLMSWFIIPKIEDIIIQRRKKIDGYIQKAEAINRQALQSLEKYQKALNKAKTEADSAIKHNKEELDKTIKAKKEEIDELLSKKIAESEYTLAKERLETMAAINNISAKLADDVLIKLGIEIKK
jgi:F-type H+-transporting ATPase subunit b